jgi:hypothetical protein
MRLMLSTTHETLLQSLRDVHAAQLQLLQLKLDHAQELLKLTRANFTVAEDRSYQAQVRVRKLELLVASQQETIKTAMSDLVILKGAGRVRSEQEKQPPPVELRPDIEITDAPTDTEARRQLLKEAREEYDRALERLSQEIDITNVTAEAAKAAIPESPEAWRREHATPSDENTVDLVPGG